MADFVFLGERRRKRRGSNQYTPDDSDYEEWDITDDNCWSVTLTTCQASGNQVLNIPAAIVEAHFRDKPEQIAVYGDVQNLPGFSPVEITMRQWSLVFDSKNHRKAMFGTGWYDFCRDNRLTKGDEVTFVVNGQRKVAVVLLQRKQKGKNKCRGCPKYQLCKK